MGPASSPDKQSIRNLAQAARRDVDDKEDRSRHILDRLLTLPELVAARVIACYVGVRNEVRTEEFLLTLLALGKQIAVPWCDGDELRLTLLRGGDELATGAFGIPEPRADLRLDAERQCDLRQVDLFWVPGVAFDEHGHRLGHGLGYYDRLLRRSRPDSVRIALAFDCQIVPAVPAEEHDVSMHAIVTESRLLRVSRD